VRTGEVGGKWRIARGGGVIQSERRIGLVGRDAIGKENKYDTVFWKAKTFSGNNFTVAKNKRKTLIKIDRD